MALGKLIYDSAMGRIPTEYSNVDKEVRETEIRKELFKALELGEDYKYEKKSFRKAMRRHEVAVYEIIEEVVDNILKNGEYQKNAFFNQFVELKNLALGDENKFYIEGDNALEFAEFSGSHWDLRRARLDVGQTFSLELRDFGIKIFEYAERIAAGRVDFAKIIAEIAEASDKKMANLAQTTLATAITNLPNEFKKTSGTYDEQAILTISQHVAAQNNGIKPTIIGTQVALSKLQGKTDIALYSDDMKNERNKIGVLSTWVGHKCVEIPQGHKVGTFEFTMDNNELYLISGDAKLVKIVIEGDTEVKDINNDTTNADKSVEKVVAFKAGAGVVYGGLIGYVKFS